MPQTIKSLIRSRSFYAGGLLISLLTFSALTFSQDLAPPMNDMFADAEVIGGTRAIVGGNNYDASLENGEISFHKNEKTVWYKWTAPADLSMTFSVRGLDFSDPVVAVYVGEMIQKLQLLAVSDRIPRITFIAKQGTEYAFQVYAKEQNSEGSFELYWDINGAESWGQFNFDGELTDAGGIPTGASDFAIIRRLGIPMPSPHWWIWQSNSQTSYVHPFGSFGGRVHPGDFDGDRITDIGVIESGSVFWVRRSSDATITARQWGQTGDLGVQGDFDGDDIADLAVWRPSTGTFWILKSSNDEPLIVQWGMSGDKLACGDYDGDGRTDLAVKRGGAGEQAYFYVLRSSDQRPWIVPFGFGDDYIVPGDYDGDGKNDIAVFRNSNATFYYLRSSDGSVGIVPAGQPLGPWDGLSPGDYVGGRTSDFCVYRAVPGGAGIYNCLADGGNGGWYLFRWGLASAFVDRPIAESNVH